MQAETFDPKRIDLEPGWAAGIGMNTMRVFLHDLLWSQEPETYKKRIDTFLAIAAKHGIRIMPVLFDSVWDPNPRLGPQRAPRPGVHNSGWALCTEYMRRSTGAWSRQGAGTPAPGVSWKST